MEYQKFTKDKNSKVKEAFRQEKKKYKKERAAYFEEQKAERKLNKETYYKKKESNDIKKFIKVDGKIISEDDKPKKNLKIIKNNETPKTEKKGKKETIKKVENETIKNTIKAEKNKTIADKKILNKKAAGLPYERKIKISKTIITKDIDITKKKEITNKPNPLNMPLNKFLAHSGVCSRRDAVEIIRLGKVKVNGEVSTDPAYKVLPTDDISFQNKKIVASKNFVYILLNKPKDFLTTTDDPQQRKTVLDLIKTATQERVYPIGRLDRNTSGLIILTNDGEFTQMLSHPQYEIKKVYEVCLDKPLAKTDYDKIIAGITLEDGFVKPDALGYTQPKDNSIIGIELHSGKNRIVRRIFESLDYEVIKLDRVMYAGLTKKNIERGKWRLLTEKEVMNLKNKKQSFRK